MAIDCRAPVYSEHAPPLNVDVVLWERLILPLGDEAVDWILTVNLPKGSRKKAEQESEAKAVKPSGEQDVFYLD
jgi:hypothetical protein